MPTVRFSQDDFLRSKVMKPGWYHSLIKNVVTKPAKSDQSDVHNVQLKVVEPGDYFGIPLQDFISEKAQSGAIRLVRASLGKEPNPEENYELANGVGRVIKVHVSNELYKGKVQNQVDDYDFPDPSFTLTEE